MASVCAFAPSAVQASAPRRSVSLRAQRSAFTPAPARCLRGAAVATARSRGAALVVRAADEVVIQGSDPKTLSKAHPAVLDIDEIMRRLPHRFPFLLVRAVAGGYFCGSRPVSVARLTRAAPARRARAARWIASSSTCPASTRSASRT